MKPDNRAIHDANWQSWLDMKVHGPASRWLRSLIRSQIERIPFPETIQSVLDVGCGEGTITNAMAGWLPHAQVVGIDFSKTGIQCAESRYQRSNLHFIHDETSQQLTQPYDLVSAFEVLEHVENWQEFLGRIAGAAQQFVLLSFPTGRMRHFERSFGHHRNFARNEVEKFMSDKGFAVRVVCYAGFPFFSPLYRDFCNLSCSASPSFVTGTYGMRKRVLSSAIYCLFRFFSTRRRFGDQFCGLFARKPDAP
jgi:SAM-dependent methyltransferase